MNEEIVFSDYHLCFETHPELWGKVRGLITGASWREYQNFMDRKVGPDIPTYFYPGKPQDTDLVAIAKWKADMIIKLGVTKYYDDDLVQVNVIKLLCPKTKVVQVFEGRTSI